MKSRYQIIPLDKILDPELPLRSDLSPESVADLVASIKQVGIIEPLVVAKKGESFEVIAGHRRLLAATIAQLATAPCMVTEVEGLTADILKIHENLARAEINPVDWAKHLDHLKSQYTLSNAKIAEILGMSEQWVDQHLAILRYSPELLDALTANRLAFSSARELAQIRDPKKREQYTDYAVRGGVTPALAAKWRREANIPTLQQTPIEGGENPELSHPTATNDPECPVCGEPVRLEESITLIVHHFCRPAPRASSS